MSTEEVIRLVFSFLGGGVAVAILDWIRSNRAEKREAKVKFLDEQIRSLYGPLYYFVSQNELLFELDSRFHGAYNQEYVNKKYSQQEYTQENLKKETQETINIRNLYAEEVEENNKKIKEILDNNYPYIDRDDISDFAKFSEHHIRLQKERDQNGRLKTPLRVYRHVGDISYLRPEFANRVKKKFFQKKDELDKLVK